MQIVLMGLEILHRAGRKLGPYLLLEILMPGGTFLALLLFLYRRNRLPARTNAPRTGYLVAFVACARAHGRARHRIMPLAGTDLL